MWADFHEESVVYHVVLKRTLQVGIAWWGSLRRSDAGQGKVASAMCLLVFTYVWLCRIMNYESFFLSNSVPGYWCVSLSILGAQSLGPNVRNGKRRQFNFIGKHFQPSMGIGYKQCGMFPFGIECGCWMLLEHTHIYFWFGYLQSYASLRQRIIFASLLMHINSWRIAILREE